MIARDIIVSFCIFNMSESSVEIWRTILMELNLALGPVPCRGSDPDLAPEIYVSFQFLWNI